MDIVTSALHPVPDPPAHWTVTTDGSKSSESFDKSCGESEYEFAAFDSFAFVMGKVNVAPTSGTVVEELPPDVVVGRFTRK